MIFFEKMSPREPPLCTLFGDIRLIGMYFLGDSSHMLSKKFLFHFLFHFFFYYYFLHGRVLEELSLLKKEKTLHIICPSISISIRFLHHRIWPSICMSPLASSHNVPRPISLSTCCLYICYVLPCTAQLEI